MKFPFLLCVSAGLLFDSAGATFSTDIAPVLHQKCLTCHSAQKAKGGYRIQNFATLLQPGKSKEAPIVPGKPLQSELFRRLTTGDEDDRMPQKDDPLPPDQVERFREWILEGAKLDRGQPETDLALLIPRAPQPVPPLAYPSAAPVLALAFSPDGKQLASSGYHEVLLWNVDGELQQRLTNAPERIHSIAFQPGAPPGEPRLAIAGGQPGRAGEISIFESGSFLTNLLLASDEMLSVAFSLDGKLLAAGGADNAIHVFRTGDWHPVNTIQQHADWVVSAAFNPAGNRIISASRDRTARIYDADSGELETTFTGHGAAVYSAVFLSNEVAASGGKEKVVQLWETADGKKAKEFPEAPGEIYAMIAQDEHLFVAGADQKVRQYSIQQRKLIHTFDTRDDSVFALAFHPGTSHLAAGTYSGTVHLWDVQNATLIRSFLASPLRKPSAHASAAKTAGSGE